MSLNYGSRLRFENHQSYNEVKLAWTSFLPAQHHLVSGDLGALEDSKPDDISFRYVNLFEGDSIIGIMYFQLLNFNRKHYDHGIFDKPFLRLIKPFLLRQSTNIIICGNIFRVNFQGFYFKDKKRKDEIFDCLNRYRKVYIAEQSVCGMLVKDCSREFSSTQYGCHSFRAFNQDLTMELNIREHWLNFKDYNLDLSRKYKQRAVKIRKALEGIETRDMSLEEIIDEKETINRLYLQIVEKQSFKLGILNSLYFVEMKKHMGDSFKVFGYYDKQGLKAFASHIYYPLKNSMEIHYIGLDYEANAIHNLYFNILFDGIEAAIKKKFKKIEMGRTAREAKANAGAHSVENFNYVWIKPGFTRLLVNIISRWFTGKVGEDWKKRNPFKTIPETKAIPEPA